MKLVGVYFHRVAFVTSAFFLCCTMGIAGAKTPASDQAIALMPLKRSIYHHGWIDLNKNGKKDVCENQNEPVNKRVDNLLSQMNMKEETMQLVTLYGYGRMLKDVIPKHVAYCR